MKSARTCCSSKDLESVETASIKSAAFSFSSYALYLVAIGCFLDVFSTFFPWSEVGAWHFFLPFSIPLPLTWNVQYLKVSFPILVISVATRVAAILGAAGLFLLGHLKNRVISGAILIVSVILSFVSVGFFSQIGLSFSYGVYLASGGGILKLMGIVLENLKVQIVVETDPQTGSI
jgi:hypothetical protein